MNVFGGIAALGHGGHGQVVATAGTIAPPGPDATPPRGAASIRHGDLATVDVQPVSVAQGLANGLQHLVGLQAEAFAGLLQPVRAIRRISEFDLGHGAIAVDHLGGAGMGNDPHPPFRGGEVLFERARAHAVASTAVDQRHILGPPQQLRLHGSVHSRHAAADDDDMTTHRETAQIIRLAQVRDKLDRVQHVFLVLTVTAQRVYASQTDAQEDRVIPVLQLIQLQTIAKRLAQLDFDPTDGQQPINLARGEIVDTLVGGNTEFVQPARLGTRIIQHHVMAVHRQTVRGGQARGTSPPHDRNHFAGRLGAGERVGTHHRIGGVTLQAADLDRVSFRGFTHADLFAECLGRADTGAHAAQDVLFQDGARGGFRRTGRNLPDEQRNVDRGRTGSMQGASWQK